MNTIEQLVEALKDLLDQGITRPVETGIGMMEELTPAVERAHKAIVAGEAELKREPEGYIRKWAYDKEVPSKEKNLRGRLAWPNKFKFLPITQHQCAKDDIALFSREETK